MQFHDAWGVKDEVIRNLESGSIQVLFPSGVVQEIMVFEDPIDRATVAHAQTPKSGSSEESRAKQQVLEVRCRDREHKDTAGPKNPAHFVEDRLQVRDVLEYAITENGLKEVCRKGHVVGVRYAQMLVNANAAR